MRFKKIKNINPSTNTELSIIKRQQAAKIFLNEMRKGRRVINIDETWIGEMHFPRKKWRLNGQDNTCTVKEVSPRLSLIVAIDNFGKIYSSMTQVNTDSEVFALFVSKLVGQLNAEEGQ